MMFCGHSFSHFFLKIKGLRSFKGMKLLPIALLEDTLNYNI